MSTDAERGREAAQTLWRLGLGASLPDDPLTPEFARAALGHANIAITLDTYSHVTPAMHQQAAEALDAVLQG